MSEINTSVVSYRNTQELIYPTTLKLRGPWLLETNHLLALDETLDKFCTPDEPEERPTALQSPPRQPIGVPHDFRSRKLLTIFLSKDRELNASGFKEAMSNIAFQGELVRGFEYILSTPNATASVCLPKKAVKKDNEEQWFLEVKVSAQPPAAGYELFLVLQNWADTIKSPTWHQWLLFEPRILYRIGLGFALLVLFATLYPSAPTAAQYKDTLKEQARELLRAGINQQNQTKAVELMLALESDYIPPGTKPQQSRKPIAWYVIAVYALGFLSFTPSICIGIWAGKRRLRWWNLWMKLNTVTIPCLVLGHWVSPQVFSIIDASLRH